MKDLYNKHYVEVYRDVEQSIDHIPDITRTDAVALLELLEMKYALGKSEQSDLATKALLTDINTRAAANNWSLVDTLHNQMNSINADKRVLYHTLVRLTSSDKQP